MTMVWTLVPLQNYDKTILLYFLHVLRHNFLIAEIMHFGIIILISLTDACFGLNGSGGSIQVPVDLQQIVLYGVVTIVKLKHCPFTQYS